MSAEKENPLIAALPPATDYLTYLTVLEFNLTREQLPILHQLLQDEKLTTNIGWDLVHLLLPLLPDSEECLQDVACLGNPREVVLKVTELLEELGTEDNEISDDEADAVDNHDGQPTNLDSTYKQLEARPELAGHPAFRDEGQARKDVDQCARFQSLLHMLCVLHPRIRTKYPSRFLSTSIQSVLPAYASLARFPAATRSVLMFLKSLSGSKRPTLPPRGTEEAIPTVRSAGAGPDPEATEAPDTTEAETQSILLRALTTHLARYCLDGFPAVGGGSGIAWTERYSEKRMPGKIVPGRKTVRETFEADDRLKERDALLAQILNVATGDLHTTFSSLLSLVLPSKGNPESSPDPHETTLSTKEFSPSPTGALYLLAFKAATSLLNETSPPFELSLIPNHRNILALFVGSPDVASLTLPSASHLPATLVDAVLTLGWLAHRDFPYTHTSLVSDSPSTTTTANDEAAGPTLGTECTKDEPFNTYLQCLTLIAATHPSPNLRNAAHDFAGAVLAGHRSAQVRLAFLRDTLQYCPYESIKASAVGWVKEELTKAVSASVDSEDNAQNVFRQSETLRDLTPLLFPSLHASTGDQATVQELLMNVPFHLAGLNLLYLLCESEPLRSRLDVLRTFIELEIEERFLSPLQNLMKQATEVIPEDQAIEMMLLEDSVGKARAALQKATKA